MKYISAIILFFTGLFNLYSQEITEVVLNDNSITVVYSIPEELHQSLQPEMFHFTVEAPESVVFGEIIYPETNGVYDGEGVYYGKVDLRRSFQVLEDTDASVWTVTAHYQLCNEEGTCFFPKRETHEITAPALAETEQPQASTGRLLLFFLFAFLGGLILNVMPCVLPVLSIKALNLVKQSDNKKDVILKKSLAYSLGIVFSLLLMAVIVIILQLSGRVLGWGFQFQNPPFLVFLTFIIFGFGLSLFDVFTLQPPNKAGSSAAKANQKNNLAGSFFTGILAVLLATPCTAPFLGAAMGFAFSQPPLIILMMFALVGLGLALPFLLLGFWPGLIKKLPKPGPWMDHFKHAMGFLLMGTAVYLISTLFNQVGAVAVRMLWFLAFSSVGFWLLGFALNPLKKKIFRVSMGLTFLIIITASYAFLLHGRLSPQAASIGFISNPVETDGEYEDFSEERLYELRAEGKPVFVEFTADWCLTCQTNKRTVLNTKTIQDFFQEQGVIHLVGDLTVEREDYTSFIQRYGRAGVPVYLLYLPGEGEPVLFPELITKKMIINAF